MKASLFMLVALVGLAGVANAQTVYERRETVTIVRSPVYVERQVAVPEYDSYSYSRRRYGLLGRPRSLVEIRIGAPRSNPYPFGRTFPPMPVFDW